MPRVEKTTGGRLRSRVADQEFVGGETYDVDAETAEYLVNERGGFEIVDAGGMTDETAEEEPDHDDLDGEEGTLPFSPASNTIDELSEKIAEIDDVETLRALRNVEEEQKNRDGATDALDARINELDD